MKRVLYATKSVAAAIKFAQLEAVKEWHLSIENLPLVRGVDSLEWLDSQNSRCTIVVWLEVKDMTVKYQLWLSLWHPQGQWHLVHIAKTQEGETKMSTSMTIDLEKFVWAYSNCPSENRRYGVVPMYYGYNGNFNDVTFVFLPESKHPQVVILDGDEDGPKQEDRSSWLIQDHFGDWSLVEVTSIAKFIYKSCTGSEITIERQGEQFVVTYTKDVGMTTYHRLRDAGYTGPIDRRPFTTLVCEHGHSVELNGSSVDCIWNAYCEVCTDVEDHNSGEAAGSQEDARLIGKVRAWWRNMGKVNFPVSVIYSHESGYRVINNASDERTGTDLSALLASFGIPVEALKQFSMEELKAQFEAGQAIYDAAFLAANGVSVKEHYRLEKTEDGSPVKNWWGTPAAEEANIAERRATYQLAQSQATQKGVEIWSLEVPESLPEQRRVMP